MTYYKIKVIIPFTILLLITIIIKVLCINRIENKTAFTLPKTFTTIDLGLTSGNLWTTCNVGAVNPWDYGNYYAWGETFTKRLYNWHTYSYCNGSNTSITKYCSNDIYGSKGFIDFLTTLTATDDVANTISDSGYSTPTYDDWYELHTQCYWVWTNKYDSHEIAGYIVYKAKSDEDKGIIIHLGETPSSIYSISDYHIFLPVTGYRHNFRLHNTNSSGYYWSSTLHDKYPCRAYRLFFDPNHIYVDHSSNRCNGRPVRLIYRNPSRATNQ